MSKSPTQSQLVSIARTAGIWYLLMAISGILGFMVFQPKIYEADIHQTVSNLIEKTNLARLRLLLEFVIILSQALTAIWFYRLFKSINKWAAIATGIWGTVNAIVIMVSAISMGVSLDIALSTQSLDDKVLLISVLKGVISNAWSVGGLFFGLWLIPMGFIIIQSNRMPIWLGRILILGGIGYLLSTFINYAGLSGSWVGSLTIPATIAEFWMIGYLFVFGIRPIPE